MARTANGVRARVARNVGRYKPDWLIASIGMFIFLDIGRLQQIFQPLGKLRPALLLSGMVIALLFATRDVGRLQSRLQHPMMKVIYLILLWGVLSVPGSVYAGGSFAYLTGNYVKTVIMVMVVVMAIRTPRDAEFLCTAMFFSIALYGIIVVQRFQVSRGERLAEMYTYDANDLAQVIVTMLPIGVFLFMTYRKVAMRGLLFGAMAVLMVLLMKTGSRGGFLGLCGSLLYMLFRAKKISTSRKIGIVVLAAVVVGVLGTVSGYWQFIGTLGSLDDDYNMNSETGRVKIWKRGIRYMMTHPIFGVGIDGFETAEGRLSGIPEMLAPGSGWKWSTAHNSFVQIGAELGIPGLIMYTAIWWGLLQRLQRFSLDRTMDDRTRLLATALGVSAFAFLVTSFFLSQAYAATLYTLMAIVVGIEFTAKHVPRGRKVRKSSGFRGGGGRRPPPRPLAPHPGAWPGPAQRLPGPNPPDTSRR